MKKTKKLLFSILLAAVTVTVHAQRAIDNLDRGVVAVKTSNGVFVSWRIQSDEYYDVTYNLYRNGSLIAENLKTSNYTDTGGTTSSTYSVASVVKGVEKGKSQAETATWDKDYLEITPKHPKEIKSTLRPNDACCADVDGDGELEIIMKYDNESESSQSYPRNGPTIDGVATGEYTIFECMKLDGTVLWWVNCGPNMGDFQNNEQNMVAYDWDMDGKAECIMRAADGTVVHLADGTTYTVGNASTNVRAATGGGTNWFVITNNEYLLYLNGATGQPYQCLPYPLKMLESGESYSTVWGKDDGGHRASKHFFGAPYLDGRKPSIFLGRGIYTQHKFVALDVDPTTHELTERWRWTNKQVGSPWYGQGYHNYSIVDVDWDGRDEIVFGGLVIDDNGKGLSTVGLGHGDAQHHGDLNPYIHGSEGWFCNEEQPNNHYRDLTTSKIYYRTIGTKDDGRAIAGNFSNTVPGAIASSGADWENPISMVANKRITEYNTVGMSQNFRCYWDGDLCEETFDGTGSINNDNYPGGIYKFGVGQIKVLTGSLTNNWTKATPCYMGDILGDWREEFIMRTADNKIRIYTTTIETPWRNYSLWYDHQYRNGMVWQMCGYNQPAHTSYFLGEMEGITAAPPALTMKDRLEVGNNGTIGGATADFNGKSVITCETNDMTVTVEDGVTPYIYIDNAPSLVEGSAPSEATSKDYDISYRYFTHTLTGGAFAGDMRLVKQGDGILTLPNVEQKYSGQTDVWAGTLNFDGIMQNSRLWLNRFAKLNTNGGTFAKGIQAEYGSVIRPGGLGGNVSSLTTDSLILNFGAIVELDIFSDGFLADQLNANVIKIEKKDWSNGPEYLSPVFRFSIFPSKGESNVADGRYCLGTIGKVEGSLRDIVIENMPNQQTTLEFEDGKLYLDVKSFTGEPMTWTGEESSEWNLNKDANFKGDTTGETTKFVTGSDVTFNDEAVKYDVVVKGTVKPDTVTFDNTKTYTISGDSIRGEAALVKQNTGTVYLNNQNNVGNTTVSGGTLVVSSLANSTGTDCGSLGTKNKTITLTNGAALSTSVSLSGDQKIYCGQGNGTINVPSSFTFTQNALIGTKNGGTLVKTGTGTLVTASTLGVSSVTLNGGTFTANVVHGKTIYANGTTWISGEGQRTSPVCVGENANVTWNLPSAYYTDVSGKVTGSGKITIVPTNKVNRVRITGNWSGFIGTLNYTNTSYVLPIKTNLDLGNATLNIGSGAYAAAVGNTVTIGKLTGNGVLEHVVSDFNSQTVPTSSNTWKVGNSSAALGDFTFDGYLYDAGSTSKAHFEKIGTCTMTVTTSWQNSGAVKINAGELRCKSGITLGTGALTVAEGAVLSGNSNSAKGAAKKVPFTNSSITVNGTLWPSGTETSESASYWAIGSNAVSFGSTGTLKVGLLKCSTKAITYNTCLVGDGSTSVVNFADGATIEAYTSSYVPTFVSEEVTDSFKVLTDVPNINVAGKIRYILPTLPRHYYWKNRWDNTLFAKTGCLYVGYIELVGDANRDGEVTMADANAVVNCFLGGDTENISLPHADVNGDGNITMADANAIVNIFLGQDGTE